MNKVGEKFDSANHEIQRQLGRVKQTATTAKEWSYYDQLFYFFIFFNLYLNIFYFLTILISF